MRKKLVRIGLVLLLSPLLIFVLLHTALVQHLVRNYVVDFLEKKFSLAVEIQDLSYNLLNRKVYLEGITVWDRNKQELPAFFKAGSIQAKIPVSLLRGKLEIDALNASQLLCVIFKGSGEVTNIPSFGNQSKKSDTGPPPQGLPPFRIAEMTLVRSSIHYIDHGHGLTLESPAVNMSLEWDRRDRHVFRIKSQQSGELSSKQQKIVVRSLTIEGVLGEDYLQIRNSLLKTARDTIELSGTIENLWNPHLNLDIQADINAASLRLLVPEADSLSGKVTARTSLRGNLASLEARTTLQGRDLEWGEIQDAGLEADVAWNGKRLSVSSLQLDLNEGKLTGQADLHPLDWAAGNRASLQMEDIDLSDFTSLLEPFPPFSSRVSGNLQTQWDRWSRDGFSGTADLTFERLGQGGSPDRLGPVLRGSIHAEVTPQQASLLIPELLTDNFSLSGDVHIREHDLSGKYRITVHDLHDIGLRYIPSAITGIFRDLRGTVFVSGRLDGSIDHPVISSQWEGSGISLLGMRDLSLMGEAVWEHQTITVRRFQLSSGPAKIYFSGIYAVGSEPAGTSIDFAVDGLQLEQVSLLLGTNAQLGGRMHFAGELLGILPFPRLEGRGRLTGLRYAGWTVSEVLLKLGIVERRLDLELSIPSLSLFVHGNSSLTEPFDFEGSSEMSVSSLSNIQPVIKGIFPLDASGKMKARLDFKGNWKSYSLMEISGYVRVDEADLFLSEPPLPLRNIRVDLALDKRTLFINNSSLQMNGARLEMTGRLPLSILFADRASGGKGQAESGRITAEFENLDPFYLGSAFGNEFPSELTGKISGDAEMTVSSLEPDSISAQANITDMDFFLWDIPLKLQQSTSLHLQGSEVVVNDLRLAGAGNSLRLGGRLNLLRNEFHSFTLEGQGDLKTVQSFLNRTFLSGNSQYHLQLDGSLDNPSLEGNLNLSHVQVEFSDPDLYVSDLSGDIRFKGNRIDLSSLEGNLNGGKFKLKGYVVHENLGLKQAALNFAGDGINMDYPAGLRSLIKAEFEFETDGSQHRLGGEVSLLAADYSEPISVESRVFQLLRRKGRSDIFVRRNKFLNDLDFNIRIETFNPARIENNLIDARVRADVKLRGSPYNPGLSGRIDFREGGEVYFGKNTYQIEQAAVNFVNPNQIVPDIGLRAQTRVSGYLIQLLVFGTPEDLSARLTSDPPLAEADILSLLLTGRRLEYVSTSLLNTVSYTALDYVEGALLGKVEHIAEQTLGLDNVRIDTSLIASQENPEARITVGQSITRDLDLVVSQGLKDTDERTIILSYDILKNLNLRAMKQDNDAYQFDVTHELRFGLRRKDRMGPQYKIGQKGAIIQKVETCGQLGLSREQIMQNLELRKGNRFDFFLFQSDLDRLQELYRSYDYLECKIDHQQKGAAGKIILVYHIVSGPRVILRISSAKVSPELRAEAKKLWAEGAFYRKRIADIRRLIKREFFQMGHFQLETQVKDMSVTEELKIVRIRIARGPRYERIVYDFPGRQGLEDQTLISILEEPEIQLSLFNDPARAIKRMENSYRYNGYLNAEVEVPKVVFLPAERTVKITLPIQEGPQFLVDRIAFQGRLTLDRDSLLATAGISLKSPFTPDMIFQAQSRLENFYSSRGFLDVQIQNRVEPNLGNGKVGLIFTISENEKSVIDEIDIFGNRITQSKIIERELIFQNGQAVDFTKFSLSQKKLYSLGIFDAIRIDFSPSYQNGKQKGSSSPVIPSRVEVQVEEMKPYYFRYGLQYDTDTGIGGIGELVRRNLLGKAMRAGGIIQANSWEQDARAYIRSPYFLGKRMDTNWFWFATRTEESGFTTSRLGTTLQQQMTIRDEYVISYNYTFEHLRNLSGDMPLADSRYNIGRVSLSISRDHRKNIFNSLQGSFSALTGEYAEKFLASDVRFLRFFGQYYTYHPLSRSLTYAAGLRIGLGRGLGQDLVPSERFYAGGGSSIRGFGYHEVGPRSPVTGNPVGGNAVIILNQELRFPVYKILGGVVFIDLGNVYPSIPDFDPLNIRKTAGLGLRLNLGFALGRLDLAFKLDRQDGESPYRLHFSLGQTF